MEQATGSRPDASSTARVNPNGRLIYLKASMTGAEDTAVLQYKASHSAFPHEATGDQFYGEDQFESYRSLGREVTLAAFEEATLDRAAVVSAGFRHETPGLARAARRRATRAGLCLGVPAAACHRRGRSNARFRSDRGSSPSNWPGARRPAALGGASRGRRRHSASSRTAA